MQNGLYRAIVSNVDDPNKMGRIKVIIPELFGEKVESTWCMPCVPVCYDNGGDFYIPKLRETVWITFEMDDLDKPVYLGGWWSPKKTPVGDNYKKDTRVISHDECSITMKGNSIDIKGNVDFTKVSINGKSLYQYIKDVVEEVNNV